MMPTRKFLTGNKILDSSYRIIATDATINSDSGDTVIDNGSAVSGSVSGSGENIYGIHAEDS